VKYQATTEAGKGQIEKIHAGNKTANYKNTKRLRDDFEGVNLENKRVKRFKADRIYFCGL
jgi:hypothetical protein